MKARVTMTCTIEYEIDPDNYHSTGMPDTTPSPETCLAQDLTQFKDDHDAFWELADIHDAHFLFNGNILK